MTGHVRAGLAVIAGVCALAGPFAAQQPPDSAKVDFGRDVQPILRANCVGCHGPTQQMNSLRLDRRRDALRGGTIPIISPGHGETSRLYLRLTTNSAGPQMPPTGPLSAAQIDTIKRWIDQGAEWPDELAGDAPQFPVDSAATGLIDALRRGDRAEFMKGLAVHPAAAKLRGPGGSTPLMAAALYGDVNAVKALVDAGADPNAANETSATALMWAVPEVAKMQLLIDRGADVNARSDDGRTPLFIAAGRAGSSAAVKLLLDKGAKVNVKAASIFGDMTPLGEAAYTGDAAVFELLVAAGSDLQAAGPFAIALAEKSGCVSCSEQLLRAAPPPVVNMLPVLLAPPIADGHRAKAMIERGADVNGRDSAGRTALMLAAASDTLPIDTIKALIDRGADVNAKADGATALSLAKQRGATPVVDLLIKAGAKDEPAPPPPIAPSPAMSPRAAIERAIPLLQKADEQFIRKAGCVSCHNNTLTAMSVAAARKQGVAVDETIASGQIRTIGKFVESWRERLIQGVGIPGDADTVSYILLGMAAERYEPDANTDAMAHYLKGRQLPDGHWRILVHRPPLESSDIQVTAASMRSLQVYAPSARRAEYDAAVRRAAAWLQAASPRVTEDHAFRLLGLSWASAPKDVLQKAARDLIATQRADGGWSQLPSLASDAYATGQALVALRESGAVGAADPAFKRGVQYLMKTQLADGSWFVKSRAIPIQPFFESGFPHGHDQWISASATNWATMALVHAVGARETTARRQ